MHAHIEWLSDHIAHIRVFEDGLAPPRDPYCFHTVAVLRKLDGQTVAIIQGADRPVTRHISRAIGNALFQEGIALAGWRRANSDRLRLYRTMNPFDLGHEHAQDSHSGRPYLPQPRQGDDDSTCAGDQPGAGSSLVQ